MKQSTQSGKVLLIALVFILLALAACTPAGSSGDGVEGDGSALPADSVVVSGAVKSISAKSWNVAGRELVVGDDTEIEKDIKVGDLVEVRGRTGDDGLTLATLIVRDRSADDSGANDSDDNLNGNDDNLNGNDDDDNANGNDDDDNANGNDDDDNANGNDDDDNANGNDDDDNANGNDDDDDEANGDDDDDNANGNDDD